jgi:hypothetical protein
VTAREAGALAPLSLHWCGSPWISRSANSITTEDLFHSRPPYPTAEELSKIVLKQAENAKITIPDTKVAEAVDALYGLSAFTADACDDSNRRYFEIG